MIIKAWLIINKIKLQVIFYISLEYKIKIILNNSYYMYTIIKWTQKQK